MGKGEARRKREARAMRAIAEKQGRDPYAVLDKKKNKQEKKKRTDNDIPASLRRMLQLKAAAEGKPRPSFINTRKPVNTTSKSTNEKQNAGDVREDTKETAAALDSQQQQQQSVDVVDKKERKQQQRNKQEPTTVQKKKVLKDRKKEFLKNKKLKKKGKKIVSLPTKNDNDNSDDDSDDSDDSDDDDDDDIVYRNNNKNNRHADDDPEERLRHIAEATKPQFGDQADAPIAINLKRKHWKGEKSDSDRCKEIFSRQMNAAQKAMNANSGGGSGGNSSNKKMMVVSEAERERYVDMYRSKLKGDQGGSASMKSLAALVRKESRVSSSQR